MRMLWEKRERRKKAGGVRSIGIYILITSSLAKEG